MKLYWLDNGEFSELVVCANDTQAAGIAKSWAEEYGLESAEWQAVESVNGYRIIVGEKVGE